MYIFHVADSTRTTISQPGGPISASTYSLFAKAADAVVGRVYSGQATHIRALAIGDGSVREIRSFPEPVLAAIGALHPDGFRISIVLADYAGTQRGTVHELDLATGVTTPLLTLPEDEVVGELVWLPDGQQYVMSVYRPVTDMTEIRRFSRSSLTSTGTPIAGTQCKRVNSMAVSPDGLQLIFQCSRPAGGSPSAPPITFRSVGLGGARPVAIPTGFRSSGPVKFSPDGQFLAYTDFDDLRIWYLRLATGERWRAFDNDYHAEVADWR
jgi:WD40 repeat protein